MKAATARFSTLALVAGVVAQMAAQAELTDLGFGLVYDSTLDITWLADANRAATSGYDADGRMTWTQAQVWVGKLTSGQVSGWRLPRMLGGGSSELSHLFTTYGISCTLYGTAADLSGPFDHIPPHTDYYDAISYWTDTVNSSNTDEAWIYTFEGPGTFANLHATAGKQTGSAYAWAVHDGNVAHLARDDIWAGYPVEGGYADTGSWMGWVYVGYAPWIWHFDLAKWLYVEEALVARPGAWFYSSK